MVQQQYTIQGGTDTIPSGIPTDLYENTLDESAWETFKRDLIRIGKNLRIVLFPFILGQQQQQRALKNWDLWGPLVHSTSNIKFINIYNLIRYLLFY